MTNYLQRLDLASCGFGRDKTLKTDCAVEASNAFNTMPCINH